MNIKSKITCSAAFIRPCFLFVVIDAVCGVARQSITAMKEPLRFCFQAT